LFLIQPNIYIKCEGGVQKLAHINQKTTYGIMRYNYSVNINKNQKPSLEKLLWKIVYAAKNQLKRIMHNAISNGHHHT
jgi:hypothetical protein